jgi:hypothetical protein
MLIRAIAVPLLRNRPVIRGAGGSGEGVVGHDATVSQSRIDCVSKWGQKRGMMK